MSLFWRIAGAISLLVVSGSVFTAALLAREADERLVERAGGEMETVSAVSLARLEIQVAEVGRDVRVLSGTPPIRGVIRARAHGGVDPVDGSTEEQWRDRLATIFEQVLLSDPRYLQVRYIGRADGGRELVRVDRSVAGAPVHRTPEAELQPKGGRDYVRSALTLDEGTLYVSPIDLNREHGQIATPHVPVLRVASRVTDAAGEVFGVIVINVDASAILRALTASSARTYMARSDGHYLLHPDPEREFGFDLGRPAAALGELAPVASVIRGERALAHVVDQEGDRLLVARRVSLGTGPGSARVSLILERPLSDVRSGADTLGSLALPVVLFGALALALGLYVARRITRPLDELARAVEAMDVVDRTLRVPEGLTGEAKQLGDALENTLAGLRATDRLEASNRELEQFAYLASHDLREPIRTVKSYVELLEEDYGEHFDEDGTRFVRFITSACDRMSARVDGLLGHSRLGIEAVSEEVDLRALVEEVVSDLGAKIDESGAEVEIGELPMRRVFPIELRMLFQNLIENALKYAREGVSPRVRITAERDTTGAWVFSVTDNGRGIPLEHREKVFQLFQRLHTRGDVDGVGLGLAHCQKIVALHHGSMWVEDGDDGGASIRFALREVDDR